MSLRAVDGDAAGFSRRARILQKAKHWTGLDCAIAFTVLARAWSALAGVVTILLIARFLRPAEQGYYYTFSSLVALQIVFELGFSFVILQLAAHERSRLTFLADGLVGGDPIAHSRLASILQKSVRWYSVAAFLMVCTLLPAGWRFFATHSGSSPVSGWKPAWCLLVVAASITFQLDPMFSFTEGCGFVVQVARMRLAQAACSSILAWAALCTHHGLFAPAMIVSGQALAGAAWLFSRRRFLLGLLRHRVGANKVGWRTEIWPFQWRIAISWLCGYFIFQLFNPVLFAYQGPIAAGQMGMSLSIVISMGGVAIAWMNTKASPFGALVSQGEFHQLDSLFFRTLKQSLTLLTCAAGLFFACLLYTRGHYPHLASRVLGPAAFGLLLLTGISNQVVFSEALYLRAHKREPFLVQSVVNAILVGTGTYVFGRFIGAGAVAANYFVMSGIFGLLVGTYIFVVKRREYRGHLSQVPSCDGSQTGVEANYV
jgi:hypothetical protein